MKIVKPLLVLSLVAQSAVAGRAQDHLVPDESIFVSSLTEYKVAIREALLSDVPLTAHVAVIIPSFEAESSIWVIRHPEPKACSRTLVRPIWNGVQPTQPVVPGNRPEPKCVPLPADIAAAVSESWLGMLRGVRYPPPSNVIGLDGTTYHFFGLDRGQRLAGQTWSPKANTSTSRLVALTEELREYSFAPTPERARTVCRLALAVQSEGRRLTSCR